MIHPRSFPTVRYWRRLIVRAASSRLGGGELLHLRGVHLVPALGLGVAQLRPPDPEPGSKAAVRLRFAAEVLEELERRKGGCVRKDSTIC